MKTQLYHNSRETATLCHPVDALEPDLCDVPIKMTAEAYNRVTQWILAGNTFEKIGLRAICIHRCALRPTLPISGLFESLETGKSRILARKMICAILGWVLLGRTPDEIGRRALSAFCAIRQELSQEKTLADIGAKMGCSKQAVSKSQKNFRKKMGMRPTAGTAQRVA